MSSIIQQTYTIMNTEITMQEMQDVRNAFNLKKHQTIEAISKINAGEADTELRRIVAELEAEGYSVKVRREGNNVYIDKTKKHNYTKSIDGHFWIEYKGRNFDITTDDIAKKMKKNKHRMVYLPVADELAQGFYDKIYNRLRDTHIAKGYDWNEWIEDVVESHERGELRDYDCVQAIILLKTKYGEQAKVRYGQVGALRSDGMVDWYFGHPDDTQDEWEKGDDAVYKKHLNPVSNYPHIIYDPRTPASCKKQKPNEICLCGSTKKFKVCCGKMW